MPALPSNPVAITPVLPIGPTLTDSQDDANDLDVAFSATDATNGNYFSSSPQRYLLMLYNASGGAATVTIFSNNDSRFRNEEITDYSIGDTEYAAFYFPDTKGWADSTGKVVFLTSVTTLKALVYRLP